MQLLKYTHPARTKYNINKLYDLQELKKELSEEMIKSMFVPLNFEWGNELMTDGKSLKQLKNK